MPANPKPCKLTTEEMVALYQKGYSTAQIGVLANRNQSTVFRRLKATGIKMRPALKPAIHSMDHSFFDVIDGPEKAYILGFLMADGCLVLARGYKRIQFHQQLRDAPHLEKITDAMSSTVPVYLRKNYADLSWTSAQQFDALSSFGIIPNKSLSGLVYPHQLRDDLHRDFIRGMIDGDGWVQPKRFGLCGSSQSLLSDCRQVILDHVPLKGTTLGKVRLEKESPRFYRWDGYPPQAKVLHWLYENACIALERKLLVVKEHWY